MDLVYTMYIFVYMQKDDDKPFPIRLGDLKAPLQEEATQNDRSLHYLIKKIIRAYVDSKDLRNSKSKR